ncbi:MAG: 30S ribosome-binding factor RbfA [Dehalococcoidales bacterium]|nr:30S ribosome-binding factor RbfA [Dehalococcoidales bacterium]
MSHRVERINSLIQEEISHLLQREVNDPRLGNFIAITKVDTASDLKHTRVYISFLGTEAERKETLKVLTVASGFFRRELSKSLKLRYTPEITFIADNSIERGDRITQLINKVSSEQNQ